MQVNTPANAIPLGHPIKIMAGIVSVNDWRPVHASETEIAVEVPGKWSHYSLALRWDDGMAALHITAEPDIFILEKQLAEARLGIARLNRKAWLGHFDLHETTGKVVFRHVMPLRGTGGATPEQMEDLIDSTLGECERAYPALFQIATGTVAAETAVAAAVMETAGSA